MNKKLSFSGNKAISCHRNGAIIVFMIIEVRIRMIMLIVTGLEYFDPWAICLFFCPLW